MVTPSNNVYLSRMPWGCAGEITRKNEATVEAVIMDSNVTAEFGDPITIDSTTGYAKAFAPTLSEEGAVTNLNFYGFLVRPWPTQDYASNVKTGAWDVMKNGYMTVMLKVGTAVKGQPVYIRVKASGEKKVGDIEASAVSGEVVELPNCTFMGEMEAPNICEIALKK